ncbi:protein kinase [Streptomyces sp. NBC_01264]|nr:serine/threonine protein kinase [Streptomyces sp. NBC_01264]MCX4780810.1 protein kinase [Streptomyces sp. NBC_01264]
MGDQLADRYRLEQRLGQGGMGEVWRAHDTALERAVAVKVLLEAATNDELVARFRREATIGARLQHPGITVVHDVGQEDGRLFIVMELLAGEDLRTALLRAPGGMPVAVALDLAAQTAEALAAAHERSVIHRDLKPANLFLLPGGRLKICDFGIAHSSDATAGWTVTGRIFGSPPYMAPEQWRGERVDARCDLYALGGVLYALLSGEPPYGEAESPYVLMRRHIEDPPLPLRLAGAQVAPEVERLVLRLLEKAPADRPESAEVVAGELRALLRAGSGSGSGSPVGSEVPVGRTAVTAPGGPATPGGPGSQGSPGSPQHVPYRAEPVGVPGGSFGPVSVPPPDTGGGFGPISAPDTGGVFGPAAAPDAGGAFGPAAVPDAGPVPAPVREFVRDLLLEAEESLRAVPAGAEARIEVLAVAADAAARFDGGLAGRLLADAEAAAWDGGGGDGARVARLLTGLAKDVSAHAPARARRLLTDAQQALFTVFGSNRSGPLRAVAEQLAKVAPEQAAQIAAAHFADGPAEKRLGARIATAVAAADPAEAELGLALIQDAGLRGAATYDMVLAVAPNDLAAALRLSASAPPGAGCWRCARWRTTGPRPGTRRAGPGRWRRPRRSCPGSWRSGRPGCARRPRTTPSGGSSSRRSGCGTRPPGCCATTRVRPPTRRPATPWPRWPRRGPSSSGRPGRRWTRRRRGSARAGPGTCRTRRSGRGPWPGSPASAWRRAARPGLRRQRPTPGSRRPRGPRSSAARRPRGRPAGTGRSQGSVHGTRAPGRTPCTRPAPMWCGGRGPRWAAYGPTWARPAGRPPPTRARPRRRCREPGGCWCPARRTPARSTSRCAGRARRACGCWRASRGTAGCAGGSTCPAPRARTSPGRGRCGASGRCWCTGRRGT